jgi:hypothetical protein
VIDASTLIEDWVDAALCIKNDYIFSLYIYKVKINLMHCVAILDY